MSRLCFFIFDNENANNMDNDSLKQKQNLNIDFLNKMNK